MLFLLINLCLQSDYCITPIFNFFFKDRNYGKTLFLLINLCLQSDYCITSCINFFFKDRYYGKTLFLLINFCLQSVYCITPCLNFFFKVAICVILLRYSINQMLKFFRILQLLTHKTTYKIIYRLITTNSNKIFRTGKILLLARQNIKIVSVFIIKINYVCFTITRQYA